MALCACGCGKETTISKYNRKYRGYKIGQPQKYILGHDRHTGVVGISNGYLLKRRMYLHRKTIEEIIGRKLPEGAVIHHVNGDKTDNSPQNLVICGSPSDHAIIHFREKALRESGHADWRKCSICKKWDDPNNLSTHTKVRKSVRHKECHRLYEIERRHKNKQTIKL